MYHMHRLTGNLHRDAATIRRAMCESKITMLERLLANPECPDYLNCTKNFIEYEPRIRRAIALIRNYPTYPTPQD